MEKIFIYDEWFSNTALLNVHQQWLFVSRAARIKHQDQLTMRRVSEAPSIMAKTYRP